MKLKDDGALPLNGGREALVDSYPCTFNDREAGVSKPCFLDKKLSNPMVSCGSQPSTGEIQPLGSKGSLKMLPRAEAGTVWELPAAMIVGTTRALEGIKR